MFPVARKSEPVAAPSPRLIPILGETQAGPGGRFPYDWAAFRIPCPPWLAGRRGLFGVIVRGESMTPIYRDGDAVLCALPGEGGETARTGEHAVCVCDDYETVLKIYSRIGDDVRLESANKNYETITMSADRVRYALRVLDHVWARHVREARVDPCEETARAATEEPAATSPVVVAYDPGDDCEIAADEKPAYRKS